MIPTDNEFICVEEKIADNRTANFRKKWFKYQFYRRPFVVCNQIFRIITLLLQFNMKCSLFNAVLDIAM